MYCTHFHLRVRGFRYFFNSSSCPGAGLGTSRNGPAPSEHFGARRRMPRRTAHPHSMLEKSQCEAHHRLAWCKCQECTWCIADYADATIGHHAQEECFSPLVCFVSGVKIVLLVLQGRPRCFGRITRDCPRQELAFVCQASRPRCKARAVTCLSHILMKHSVRGA